MGGGRWEVEIKRKAVRLWVGGGMRWLTDRMTIR